ncbi:MAG: UDP-N-acetylmuramoyl-L-alanyl-D-glutamate--2,6-diaminopimelate ligase [Ruminococcaceae bacterium]|nr:UDP-N-acetylmuramoyl-L-alanyl-D-glutamate--2,6-diaminopimelate ligase [Oscillospiraceae bacterium]
MKIRELIAGVEIKTSRGAEGKVKGITSDSRSVKHGWMFICIKGMHRDGHDYIDEARKNGAVFLVGEDEERLARSGVGYAVCENARLAEAVIWNNRWGNPSSGMKKIAVTGSMGKTSTVFILREILRRAGHRVGIVTTVRTMAEDDILDMGQNGGSSLTDRVGAMTTPDPEYFTGAVREMRKRGCDVLIYEASSHAIDMHKTDAFLPDIVLFTNLTEEHLDYHGDMETYLGVKASLVRRAPVCIANADDPRFGMLTEQAENTRFIKCSMIPDRLAEVDVCALRYRSLGCDGIEYVYFSGPAVFRVTSPIIGSHSVYNTMLAARCAMECGVDPLTVKSALASLRPVDGRMCRVEVGADAPVSLFIDYAHTAAALESVLKSLSEIKGEGQRLIVVFGCGGDRDPAKRSKMGAAAQKYADLTVVTSDNARSEDPLAIISQILSGMSEDKPYAVIPDREEAIRYAVENAREGDIILLAGKGHEKYEITKEGKRPFDEEKIAKEAVRHCFGD